MPAVGIVMRMGVIGAISMPLLAVVVAVLAVVTVTVVTVVPVLGTGRVGIELAGIVVRMQERHRVHGGYRIDLVGANQFRAATNGTVGTVGCLVGRHVGCHVSRHFGYHPHAI